MHRINLYKYLVFFIIFVVFSACASNSTDIIKPTSIKVQKDDVNFTYAYTNAKTKEDALNIALSKLASKLATKVNSSFTNKEIQDGYYSKSISSSEINRYIKNIQIDNYEILISKKLSQDDYYLGIRLDNKRFYKILYNEIQTLKNNIILKLESVSNLDALNRYFTKKFTLKEFDKLLAYSLLAYELNNNFDKNIYFNFVADIKDDYLAELNSMRFFILADLDAKFFVKPIKQLLLNNNFNIVQNNELSSILLVLKSTDDIAYNKKIATIKLSIEAIDAQKKVLKNELVFKEKNSGSKLDIYHLASKHFELDAQELGLQNILGVTK